MTIGAMDLPPEGMLLGGVALAGDPERGTATTEGLSLLFTADGITVQGPPPQADRLLPWAGLATATCHDQVQLPSGAMAAVLVLTSGSQAIRFLLSSENVSPGQAAYLDQALPAWLAHYRGTPAPTGPETAAAGAAAAGAAAAAAAGPETAAGAAAPAGAGTPPPGAVSPGPPTQPTAAATPPPPTGPEIDPVTGAARWPDPAGAVGAPAPGSEPLSPLPVEGEQKKPDNRRTLILLVVLIVVVVGAGIFFLVHRSSTTTAPPATSVTPPTSAVAADHALAVSINLRLADLPPGWTVARPTPTSTPTSPSGRTAQTQAVAAFAGCLGMPVSTISQLFGDTPQADVVASASSPVFQSPTDPNIQMQSSTNVVRTPADAVADAAPFTKPNFVPCFQAFETAAAAATSAPGTTAQVTAVPLTPPTGGQAFGYLTTLTIPGQGTAVVGSAFIIGGRIEATLQPSTNGPAVPSAAFSSAYDAMINRISAASN